MNRCLQDSEGEASQSKSCPKSLLSSKLHSRHAHWDTPRFKEDQTQGRSFFFFFSNSSGTNQQLHCACVAMGNAYLDVEKCPIILCHLKNSIEVSLPAGWYWIFSSFLVHNQFVTVKCWFRSRLVCYIHVKTQSAMQWNENNLSTCCKIQKY